jgi:LacI family transcriptional regulator
MPNTRATVKEIARLAGVSIGTVDRVLHERGGVSTATGDRVRSIVQSLGYEPNVLARQLSLNRSWRIRALLPRADQDSGYWAFCRAGIERAARDLASFGLRLLLDEFDRYDPASYRVLLEAIVEDPGDGLVIAPVMPELLCPALARLDGRVPYAFFDAWIEGASPRVSIGQDAVAAGRLAGRMLSLLAESGRPLAAICDHSEDRHIRQRIEGFAAFFEGRRAAPTISFLECPDLDRPSARDSLLGALFARSPAPGGILVAGAAGHLVGEWLAAGGLKDSCALVCWDLVPANARCLGEGSIDCVVSQRPYEQGREALELLFRGLSLPGEAAAAGRRRLVPLDLFFKENLPAQPGERAGIGVGDEAPRRARGGKDGIE